MIVFGIRYFGGIIRSQAQGELENIAAQTLYFISMFP